MLAIIKGAGDLASGVAVRLHRAGVQLIMTDIDKPTAIRRTVSFCRAVWEGHASVEDVHAQKAAGAADALRIAHSGTIAVLVDPSGACIGTLQPDAVIDARLMKQNIGTHMTDAPVVIALGPGYWAGLDCHAVVETMRGHDLGRVITQGSAQPDTGRPGNIGGYTAERILRAPCDGVWQTTLGIGSMVKQGEVVASVAGMPVFSQLNGVLRGLLPNGTPVRQGMKSGDVDPRGVQDYCLTVSDKARAIVGGVLEALLMLSGGIP